MWRSEDRLVGLLALTTMGVYALIAAGATTAITEAARACRSWPSCGGASPFTPAVAIVWSHRVAATLVGVLLVATLVMAWRRPVRRRVRLALTVAVAIYPLQVGVGALAATAPSSGVSVVHLGVGLVIFAATVLALAWTLEPETSSTDRDPATVPDEGPTQASVTEDTPTDAGGPMATVRAYVRLTKPRLMWLLCLVAAAGMALAARDGLAPFTVVATLGGGVLAIGASGTFNNVLERERDRRMARTADRPVATHRVSARRAMAFGGILTVASLVAFLQVNLLAAALGLTAILYYSVVYTLILKPNTVQNTVIGGFAGSLPALIGWAAVTNSLGVPALALAGLIFLWTPAHFYNLAMAYRDDYERGGFPMVPVVYGDDVARKHVLLYLGATMVAAAALIGVAGLDVIYAATTVLFGAVFLAAAVAQHRDRSTRAALRTFHASNAYLGAVLIAIVIDALAV